MTLYMGSVISVFKKEAFLTFELHFYLKKIFLVFFSYFLIRISNRENQALIFDGLSTLAELLSCSPQNDSFVHEHACGCVWMCAPGVSLYQISRNMVFGIYIASLNFVLYSKWYFYGESARFKFNIYIYIFLVSIP